MIHKDLIAARDIDVQMQMDEYLLSILPLATDAEDRLISWPISLS